MSDLGNKEIFAENLNYYMTLNHKDRNDIARDLELPYTTVTSWCNAEFYPRIDKIQLLANYFCIQKSDLVEQRTNNASKISDDEYQKETTLRYGKDTLFLLENYNQLNEYGKQKANENVKDLTKILEYTEKKEKLSEQKTT